MLKLPLARSILAPQVIASWGTRRRAHPGERSETPRWAGRGRSGRSVHVAQYSLNCSGVSSHPVGRALLMSSTAARTSSLQSSRRRRKAVAPVVASRWMSSWMASTYSHVLLGRGWCRPCAGCTGRRTSRRCQKSTRNRPALADVQVAVGLRRNRVWTVMPWN